MNTASERYDRIVLQAIKELTDPPAARVDLSVVVAKTQLPRQMVREIIKDLSPNYVIAVVTDQRLGGPADYRILGLTAEGRQVVA
jgi:hypothetical protein